MENTMFITGIMQLSTAHLDPRERAGLERALAIALADGETAISIGMFTVHVHSNGILFNITAAVHGIKPAAMSATTWAIIAHAEHHGCEWLLFDTATTPDPRWPVFAPTAQGEEGD
jgi:hypothetical protein